MGNRKPNLSQLLAAIQPQQDQFDPSMLLIQNPEQMSANMPVQAEPMKVVNQINKMQTSSPGPQQVSYQKQLDDAFYKQMQDRQRQIAEQQAQMQSLQGQSPNAFKEANLGTLLAYADELTGSNLAQSYKAPTAAQERKAMIEKLRGEVTKSQQGIADDQLAYLKQKAQEQQAMAQEQRMMAKLGGQNKSSDFEKSYMKKIGADFADYTTKDRPILLSNIDKVNETINLIDSGKVKGRTAYTPDFALGLFSPEEVVARDNITSAIQDTLRPTLGAQFTENEGKRIMSLAYNEKLGAEVNKSRAEKLREVMANKIRFQDDLLSYIRQNGSDAGFPYNNYGMVKADGSKTSQVPMQDKKRVMLVNSKTGETEILVDPTDQDLQEAALEGWVAQ